MELELFISWSGNRSKALARRLTEWLPSIVPSVKPFFSNEIPGGLPWSQALFARIESAKFGIVCVTSDNLHSSWLNFEAGSLWKNFEVAPLGKRAGDGIPVCPLLLGLHTSDLTGPLSLFQAKSFSEEGVKALCLQLAELTALPERRMAISFEAVWPRLQADVAEDLSSLRGGTGEYISIFAPLANTPVRRRPLVEGWVEDSSAEVWVVIHPLTVSRYWVQPPVIVAPDGKWKTRVYIGRAGQEDVGVRYQIRAVANPEVELHENLVLNDWPVAEWSSPILEVVRVVPEEAASAIRHFALANGLRVGAVSQASSPFGTSAFKVKLLDGKGAIYCHASGPLRGRIFYIRGGIGWYYEHELGGSVSALGLPTSHEEKHDVKGCQISYFEGGYIEWSDTTKLARAVATASGTDYLIGERKL